MATYSYMEMREEMVKIAKLLWEKRLTNAAGGNFAVRVADGLVLSTPTMMSEIKHCELEPKDMLLIDYDQNILEGEGALSRETLMHILLLSNFKNIGATIHAHPHYCMPFVAHGKAIKSVTDATFGRGDVEHMEYAKPYSEQSALNVLKYFEERREIIEENNKPVGCIMPKHGIIVSGPTIYMAYSMVERIETDAYCNIVERLI